MRSYWTDDLDVCPFFDILTAFGVTLAVASIPAPVERPRASSPVHLDEAEPTPEAAFSLCEDPVTRKTTEFYKEAKKMLKGKEDYFPYLFENAMFPRREGQSRHETLKKWVASVCYYLSALEPVPTAAHIYALFVPQAQQLSLEEGHRDFCHEVWRIVANIWSKELGRVAGEKKVKEEKKQEEEKQKVEISERIMSGVRAWPGVKVPAEAAEAWEWVKERMIVVTETGHHFVMKPDGHYALTGVKKAQLVAQIRNLGMLSVIDTVRPAKNDEGLRIRTYDELAGDYVTNVKKKIRAQAQIAGAYLEDTDQANPGFVYPSFRRNPKLTPQFSPDVDRWVKALAGSTKSGRSLHEQLNKQIGLFLAFERGAVCAMSFRIDPGAGKKLLVHGFMETLENPELAHSRDLISGNNPGLLVSPFISINEGFETVSPYANVSDTVRKLITGDSHVVNEKYMPEVTVRFPYRVILTANDDSLVIGLAGGRDLAPAARKAIAVRFQHYEPGDAPIKLLQEMGEWNWTKGWIARDGDSSFQSSDFVVARHFLWLYEKYGKNAEPTDAHGLLMAGDPECSPVDVMRTQGGSTPAVVEMLLKRLDTKSGAYPIDYGKVDQKDAARHGVLIHEKRLYVLPGPLLDFARKELDSGAFGRMQNKNVKLSLRGLIQDGGPDGEKTVSIAGRKQRWYEIDVPLLAQEAEKGGWTCDRLQALLLERDALVHGTNGTASHPQPVAQGA